MVVVKESQHERSLNFRNQRQVVILRDQGYKWSDIQERVENLQKETPSLWLIKDVYKTFNRREGKCRYNYKNCGMKVTKFTPAVKKFLVKRLLELRTKNIVTSTVLQRELLRLKNVEVENSGIRKVLKKAGYKWMPRAQKPKFSPQVIAARLAFCQAVLRMSKKALRERLSLAMDGVILTIPPKDSVDRENHCHYGDTHMYRKPSERASPELAGSDCYAKQVPISRAIPLWGGISEGGFAPVVFHPDKKLDSEEWVDAVEGGKLVGAIKKLDPVSKHGPWWVLCDNESFLTTAESRAAYRKVKVKLWKIPPKSPDLNPVERFWGWVRKELRAHDSADLRARRKVPGKTAYMERVKRLLKSRKAQKTASNMAAGLRKVCRKIVHEKQGQHSGQ